MKNILVLLFLYFCGCDAVDQLFKQAKSHVDPKFLPRQETEVIAVTNNIKKIKIAVEEDIAKNHSDWKLVESKNNPINKLLLWYRSPKGNLIITAQMYEDRVKAQNEFKKFVDVLEAPLKDYSTLAPGAVGGYNSFYNTSMITAVKSNTMIQVNGGDFEQAESVTKFILAHYG